LGSFTRCDVRRWLNVALQSKIDRLHAAIRYVGGHLNCDLEKAFASEDFGEMWPFSDSVFQGDLVN
jgi:hypothetical protein